MQKIEPSRPHSVFPVDQTTRPRLTARVTSAVQQIDWWIVALVLAIKALVLGFGAFSYTVLADQPVAGLEVWNRWDAPHYLDLARYGYSVTGEQRLFLVFYPLFPWLVRATAFVLGDVLISAFAVSAITSVVAALLLYRLALLDHVPEVARQAVWFLLIFPTSYFLHIGYTESLFLMLVLGCFLTARQERWLLAGALGALASLTRVNGLILIPALVVEAWTQYRGTGRWNWRWLAIGAVGLGFVGYLLLNFHVTGNPLTFLAIQHDHWYKSLAWPWIGIGSTIERLNSDSPAEAAMVGGQELIFIALGLVATISAWWKLRPAYGMWMTGNWLLITSTSFILSTPRYTLALFPLFILFARLARYPWWYAVITVWSLLWLAIFASLFVWGHWAF